jgi:Uma2 family endonuclease
MITDINQLSFDKIYSYSDYLSWKLKERVELIKGKIFMMTPAPSLSHQQVSGELFREISVYLKGRSCQVFHAPFDVRLPKKGEDEIYTVVQPDITVVCDESKLDDKGCLGVPDLVVEIISPSTANKDLHEKYELYEQVGVKEYWVVFPMEGTISVFLLNEKGEYTPIKPYTFVDRLESKAISGLTISLTEVFPKKLQEPEEPYGENVIRI